MAVGTSRSGIDCRLTRDEETEFLDDNELESLAELLLVLLMGTGGGAFLGGLDCGGLRC